MKDYRASFLSKIDGLAKDDDMSAPRLIKEHRAVVVVNAARCRICHQLMEKFNTPGYCNC